MPGANPGAIRGTSLLIEYLDSGAPSEFNPQLIGQLTYGTPIAKRNWESLEVKDTTFFRASPVCGFSVSEGNKIIVFGGQSVN